MSPILIHTTPPGAIFDYIFFLTLFISSEKSVISPSLHLTFHKTNLGLHGLSCGHCQSVRHGLLLLFGTASLCTKYSQCCIFKIPNQIISLSLGKPKRQEIMSPQCSLSTFYKIFLLQDCLLGITVILSGSHNASSSFSLLLTFAFVMQLFVKYLPPPWNG